VSDRERTKGSTKKERAIAARDGRCLSQEVTKKGRMEMTRTGHKDEELFVTREARGKVVKRGPTLPPWREMAILESPVTWP